MDSIFEEDADEVGGEIEAYCPSPRCKADTTHTFYQEKDFIAPLGVAGVKVVSDYIDNWQRDLPSEMALVNLFVDDVGVPGKQRGRAALRAWYDAEKRHYTSYITRAVTTPNNSPRPRSSVLMITREDGGVIGA